MIIFRKDFIYDYKFLFRACSRKRLKKQEREYKIKV